MKNLLFGLFVFGLISPAFTQIVELSEVTVYATNYKYLTDVNTKEIASIPVKMLEREVANFNVKESDLYHDDYDEYVISFYIPEGKILAAYDRDGKILRTAERFKNISLPKTVSGAVAKRFPGWSITKDIYLVNYYEGKDTDKIYKLKLENGEKTLRVKLDEKGNFL